MLEHIDGLKNGQSQKNPSPAKTVLEAAITGDRELVLRAQLESNAAALDRCRSAVGRAQISKEIREIMAEITAIKDEGEGYEETVLVKLRKDWKSRPPIQG